MRNTSIEQEVILPILKLICLPTELIIQHTIVVRPLQTLTDTSCESIHLHVFVIVEDVERKV